MLVAACQTGCQILDYRVKTTRVEQSPFPCRLLVMTGDGFWLDEDREIELLDEQEIEYEEQVVREDEDKRFELERRLHESSISAYSLMQSLVQASDDLLIFSLDKEK
ncbi:hypothetical protein Tco_0648083 [Tanacetum coccineum]